MGKAEIMGLVRHILTFGGGYLVAQGSLTEADMTSAVAAGMTLVGIVWSYMNKRGNA